MAAPEHRKRNNRTRQQNPTGDALVTRSWPEAAWANEPPYDPRYDGPRPRGDLNAKAWIQPIHRDPVIGYRTANDFLMGRPAGSVREALQPLPTFQSEADFANWLLPQLGEHFHVFREVRGTHCSGKLMRIDAVLMPRDYRSWYDGPAAAFGLELKMKHRESRDADRHIAQCFDYTHTTWDNFGRLAIFACPSPFLSLDPDGTKLTHLLGQLMIGELLPTVRYGWTLTLHGHHRQWSQLNGVKEAARRSLRPKAGSR